MYKKIIHSIKWSAFSELVSKILPPVFYIISARLLTPEDFGVVATASMVIAFASIIWEAGLSKALIQNQEHDKINKISNVVFYSNFVISVILYFILFISSNFLAYLFNDMRLSDILRVSGISFIIGSLMSVQTALLQKDFRFKELFYSRFVGAIVPGITSVILAYLGFKYWALIWGTIISMAMQAFILWKISSWRPSLDFDWDIAKKLFKFSRWVLLSGLLSWFYMWGDLFVLSLYFNAHELGLYRTGNYFVSTILGFITAPILPVMYSYFSKIQHDKEEIKNKLLLSSKMLSFFVLPTGVFLYVMQDTLSNLIFGAKWNGIAYVIGVLAVQQSISWTIGLNTEAYKAVGRPDIETKILIYSLPIYLIVYIFSANISFEFFLVFRFLVTFIGLYIHLYFSKKTLNISFFEYFKNIKIMLLFILTYLSSYQFLITIYNISEYKKIMLIIIFTIFYVVLIARFDKIFYVDFHKYIAKKEES